MANSGKRLKRTVQYWRLVDAASGKNQSDIDWMSFLRPLATTPISLDVDGRRLTGTSHAVSMQPHEEAIQFASLPGRYADTHASTTFGLTIAADKDYVPNQAERESGTQMPMGLHGSEWTAVDNLFVWHLPFGNMIGLLAESMSASRAATYAAWLTRAMHQTGHLSKGSDLMAVPVIDKTRAKALKQAKGLKRFVYAGEIGESVPIEASALREIFGPDLPKAHGIKLELKASISHAKGVSTAEDTKLLLSWFEDTFGSLRGAAVAEITPVPEPGKPVTEVDLLHHRLTRKRGVTLIAGPVMSFDNLSAHTAIIEAFALDRDDLVRLRSSTDH